MHKIIKISLILSLLTFNFSLFTYASPFGGRGASADYSDPDICQAPDGTYWLTASSFQTTPGLPLLSSTDCINWQFEGYALEKLIPEEVYNTVQHGKGVWAPSIRYHQGEYYIYWGDPDFGVFMVHTSNPRGVWSKPVWVLKAKGVIDTTPLWDDDGRCYLVNGWAGSRCGFNSVITIRELSADGTEVISQPRMVYDGLTEGNHTIEGPKLYKQNGYYYILAPAGGVEKGWQLALRSRNIYGPYESKVVFNKDGIHQGGWVGDKFVCFQDQGVYGRILRLLTVKMQNNWPMMSLPTNHSSLITNHLAEGYTWHSNYQDHYGFQANDYTRVYGEYTPMDNVSLWNTNNLYLRKFLYEEFTDTLHTTISSKGSGQEAGFVIMGRDYCRIAVEYKEGVFNTRQIILKNADLGKTETEADIYNVGTCKARKIDAGANPIYQTPMHFAIRCHRGGLCTLSYSTDGKHWTNCPTQFQARQGKWIGAKYGVYAISQSNIERNYIDLKKLANQ